MTLPNRKLNINKVSKHFSVIIERAITPLGKVNLVDDNIRTVGYSIAFTIGS